MIFFLHQNDGIMRSEQSVRMRCIGQLKKFKKKAHIAKDMRFFFL